MSFINPQMYDGDNGNSMVTAMVTAMATATAMATVSVI